MNRAVIEAFREATAQAPAGAQERVWRRLDASPAPGATRPWGWALGSALVAAGLAALVLARPVAIPQAPSVPYRGSGFSVVAPGARLSGRVLTLDRGTALVSSWGGAIEVLARGHRVTADAALFAVQVAGEQVQLTVAEGAVRLDGEPVGAPFGPGLDFGPVRALEPPAAQVERDWVLAENAEADGRIDEALERFTALGRRSSLRAEAALVRRAQLELWSLKQPALALQTIAAAQARFPEGALSHEAALFELEALVAQGAWAQASARADAFVARFTSSERLGEVHLIAAVSALRLGLRPAACAHFARVDLASPDPAQAANLKALEAECRSFER